MNSSALTADVPALDDRRVAAAALAALDRMYPETLHMLWKQWNDPLDMLAAVQSGRAVTALAAGRRDAHQLVRAWQADIDLVATEARLLSRGTQVFVAGADDFPFETEFPHGPIVLFGEGQRPDALGRPRVGVVGTRAATPHGRVIRSPAAHRGARGSGLPARLSARG